MSMTWQNWFRMPPLSLISFGIADDRAVARAAPVRGDLLGPLVGRVHRPRPADREVVVGRRRTELVDLRDHELGRLERAHAVEVGHLVEGALERALGRRAVVADDHVDERVVVDAEVLDRVDHPSRVVVGVLHEGRVDLHLALEDRLQRRVHVVPGRDLGMARRQLRVRTDDPELLLACERDLALLVPAVGELALVLVDPLLGDVVRCMRRPGREVHEERLVRHQRLLLAHPADGVVGQVLGEVVALLGRLRSARPASALRTAPGSTGCPRRR